MLQGFMRPGKASFILGGQWGSEGKGAAAAFIGTHLAARGEAFDVVATNAGAQAGHTSTHDGKTRVVFHLPTASLFPSIRYEGIQKVVHYPVSYLDAGSIIDVQGLLREIEENPEVKGRLFIHPNAAIITDECRLAEMADDSAQTKIASTRKGVGQALSRKVLRSGKIAADVPELQPYVRRLDLNDMMSKGSSILVEVPQGVGLSIDSQFYPHTTSRNCTVMQAMSDAGIHPHFYHQSMLVLRTFPIRVGNIMGVDPTDSDLVARHLMGYSGGHYPDQRETSWEELGQKAEITTVTKRIRRVFTFSEQQAIEAIALTRPNVIYLTFCDYVRDGLAVRHAVARLHELAMKHGNRRGAEILTQWGPTTDNVRLGL